MKKKINPLKGLKAKDAISQPQSSNYLQNFEPSDQSQNLGTGLSNKPTKFPKNLFKIVRHAGIEVSNSFPSPHTEGCHPETDSFALNLPTLPDSIFPTLPAILQKVVAMAESKEERDIMLIGSMVSFGACLPKFHGYYDGKKMFPYLYLFITAPASAGKGRLALCKQLVMPIHLLMRQESERMKEQYELDLEKYYKMRGKKSGIKKPAKPPELMLIIPANNSATGVFQLLHENGGKGLLFETEGDTLAQAFKADHGNYSDGLRKGSQHEAISYYRRTDHELVEILVTYIAAVLSGTNNQVALLIPSAENGLLSRFIFYKMNIRPIWKDVFAANGHKNLEEYFDQLGQEFLPLYKALNAHPEIEFSFSEAQKYEFNAYFAQIQGKYLTLQGIDYIATIRRLGLIAFRIAMIFTALRVLETGDFSTQQVCSEVDFQSALSMINILVRHSSHVFSELQHLNSTKPKDKKDQFLNQLPERFTCREFSELAKSLSLTKRTAERYISLFCDNGFICRDHLGTYTNLMLN